MGSLQGDGTKISQGRETTRQLGRGFTRSADRAEIETNITPPTGLAQITPTGVDLWTASQGGTIETSDSRDDSLSRRFLNTPTGLDPASVIDGKAAGSLAKFNTALNDIGDVNVPSPSPTDVLAFNSQTSQWVASGIVPGGGGGSGGGSSTGGDALTRVGPNEDYTTIGEAVTSGNYNVVVVGSITETGTLNLNNNGLYIDYAGPYTVNFGTHRINADSMRQASINIDGNNVGTLRHENDVNFDEFFQRSESKPEGNKLNLFNLRVDIKEAVNFAALVEDSFDVLVNNCIFLLPNNNRNGFESLNTVISDIVRPSFRFNHIVISGGGTSSYSFLYSLGAAMHVDGADIIGEWQTSGPFDINSNQAYDSLNSISNIRCHNQGDFTLYFGPGVYNNIVVGQNAKVSMQISGPSGTLSNAMINGRLSVRGNDWSVDNVHCSDIQFLALGGNVPSGNMLSNIRTHNLNNTEDVNLFSNSWLGSIDISGSGNLFANCLHKGINDTGDDNVFSHCKLI